MSDSKASIEKPSVSTAWDVSYDDVEPKKKKKAGKRSRRNSVSDIDTTQIKGKSQLQLAIKQ